VSHELCFISRRCINFWHCIYIKSIQTDFQFLKPTNALHSRDCSGFCRCVGTYQGAASSHALLRASRTATNGFVAVFVKTACYHLHSFCATGRSSGLAITDLDSKVTGDVARVRHTGVKLLVISLSYRSASLLQGHVSCRAFVGTLQAVPNRCGPRGENVVTSFCVRTVQVLFLDS
jgi:hypothetical protein